VWPPGDALVVSTAHRFRQVRNQLWPIVRRAHRKGGLSGKVGVVEWKDDAGDLVGYGFASDEHDPDAVSGVHAPHLLVLVDEAGGINHDLGQAFQNLMTGLHTRLLVLGNPPIDTEGTWFETICQSPQFNVIRVPADATPHFTGEEVSRYMLNGLVSPQWVEDAIAFYGADSPYVQARVHARFPKGSANQTIPSSWVEAARQVGLRVGATRFGVDVASDGGDELVVARADGPTVRLVHTSSGPDNANAVDVAGKVLVCIQDAAPGTPVKIDSIGVGWGVASQLERWGDEGKHACRIVRVNVGERASDPSRYVNRRAEMWWAGRQAFEPATGGPDDGSTPWRLDVDERTAAQLCAPRLLFSSGGQVQIERKQSIKARGLASPDRAEAVLLAIYDPHPEQAVEVSGFERLRGLSR
jgi:hypothetical protein